LDFVGRLRTTGKTMNHIEFRQIDAKSQDKSINTGITESRKRSSPRATISFEELCPQWSLALTNGVSLDPSLDIKEGKKCIVGEAHGFRNSAFLCSRCWEYSQSFVSSVYGNELSGYFITDHELFESIKDDFLRHFNQKHVNGKYKLSTILDNVRRLIQSLYRITAIIDAPNQI
jgi:hypothetical protein